MTVLLLQNLLGNACTVWTVRWRMYSTDKGDFCLGCILMLITHVFLVRQVPKTLFLLTGILCSSCYSWWIHCMLVELLIIFISGLKCCSPLLQCSIASIITSYWLLISAIIESAEGHNYMFYCHWWFVDHTVMFSETLQQRKPYNKEMSVLVCQVSIQLIPLLGTATDSMLPWRIYACFRSFLMGSIILFGIFTCSQCDDFCVCVHLYVCACTCVCVCVCV